MEAVIRRLNAGSRPPVQCGATRWVGSILEQESLPAMFRKVDLDGERFPGGVPWNQRMSRCD